LELLILRNLKLVLNNKLKKKKLILDKTSRVINNIIFAIRQEFNILRTYFGELKLRKKEKALSRKHEIRKTRKKQ
jgi:hypothetical protein